MKKATKKTVKQAKGGKPVPVAKAERKPTAVAKASPERKAANGKVKAQHKPVDAKLKRVSALGAAATVLQKASKPMRAQEMIAAMSKQGLWSSPNGKTPHATLYAAIIREIAAKGTASRFRKVERGQFAYAGKERQ